MNIFTEDRNCYCGRRPFLTKTSEISFVHLNETVLACTHMHVHTLFNVQTNTLRSLTFGSFLEESLKS